MIELLDFYADWCQPCQSMKPIIAEISKDYSVNMINVEEEPELAGRHRVMSLPTFIITKDGKPVDMFVGVRDKQFIIDKLEKYGFK